MVNEIIYLLAFYALALTIAVICLIVLVVRLRKDVKWNASQEAAYLKAIHGLLVPQIGGYNCRHTLVKQKCTGCAGGCEECRPKNPAAKNTLKPFKLRCTKCGHEGPQNVEENGPHHTATCEECGKFIKHLSAGELRVWKNSSGQLA